MTTSSDAFNNLAYIAAMLSICVVAVALNVLVIAIIGKIGRFRTSVEIFLTNLAVSDIIHAGVVLPIHFKNLSVQNEDFYGDSAACKVVMFIPLFSVMASISTMVAIAADRYRVMVRRQALARYETLIIICATWLVAFCISAPQLYEYNIYQIHNNETNLTQMTCGSEGIVEHFETAYAATVFILAYCVPFLILVICYVKVLALIQRHTNRFRLSRNSSNITTAKNSVPIDSVLSARKVRVLKMLVAITVAFGALWTPYFILFAIQEMTDLDHITELGKWPHLVSRTMTIISTATNPTLYLIFSNPFRKALFNACTCSWNIPEGMPSVSENASGDKPVFACCNCWRRHLRRVAPDSDSNKNEDALTDRRRRETQKEIIT